jgi:hypothetical protein
VPWLVIVAGLLAALGGILSWARGPSTAELRIGALAFASVTAIGALALFGSEAATALAALQGLEFGTGGTRGVLQVVSAAGVLGGLAGGAIYRRGRSGLIVALLALIPIVAGDRLFPGLRGTALAAAAVLLGLAVGVRYPPAIAPTTRKGSRPSATAAGSGASGGSNERSRSQA